MDDTQWHFTTRQFAATDLPPPPPLLFRPTHRRFSVVFSLPLTKTKAANFTIERFLLKNLPTDEPTHAYGSTRGLKPHFGNGFDFPLTAHAHVNL